MAWCQVASWPGGLVAMWPCGQVARWPGGQVARFMLTLFSGKVSGVASTRCHDGKVLPFRSRCNKFVECGQGEDEAGCDWHKHSSIKTVTGAEFDQVLENSDNVLVEFFAPWCPACVTFLPQLEKLERATRDIPLTVVKVRDQASYYVI